MQEAPLLMGIDLGTSGLKTVLIETKTNRIIAEAKADYQPVQSAPGHAEQDPDDWLAAAGLTIRQVLDHLPQGAGAIAGIGFSGQMHSAVLLDRAGAPLRPAILWLDRRSTPQLTALLDRIGLDQLYAWIGNPLAAGFTLPTLLWLRDCEPDSWSQLDRVIQPKDYLRFFLTGTLATDWSDASATGLLSVGERQWCQPLLSLTGLPAAVLPSPIDSTQVVGAVLPGPARALGVPELAGVPVVCGAGDQEAQAVGNNIVSPGAISCTIGTGGQLFAVADRYQPDPAIRLHTFCHAVPDRWHWQAATLTAGQSLNWLREKILDGQLSFQQLADGAASVSAGVEGLTFLPYLAGERTPHMDPTARGVFYGLTLRHDWRHMARAVMEGVVYALRDGLDLIRQLMPVTELVASGGGTRHPLWQQLQADIFDLPITQSATREAAAVGAALLAGVGVGLYPDLPTARTDHKRHTPNPANQSTYERGFERYRALYSALAPHYAADANQKVGG